MKTVAMTNDKLLKALCSYAPYELIIQEEETETFKEVHGINLETQEYLIDYNDIGIQELSIEYGKPILYDLDLTKPIPVNGKMIVPIDELDSALIVNKNLKSLDDIGWSYQESSIGDSMMVIEKLLEWRVDIFGLIPSGDAISVNDLDINPYK